MKLIMSAVTPLSLDEIRVALCVVLGEPVWHPEKMAKDGSQLITLCGGTLLDLDEEDGKVRFIHHSVIQHLLLPAASESTMPYHFSNEDAENFMGATCVTYLHLSVLDSRITVTRNLQSRGMLDNVIGTTQDSLPGVNRWVQHIKSREHKRTRSYQFDIGHVVSQIQAARIQQDIDPRCFAPYATSHWVSHTRFFDDKIQYCKESWTLWWRLLNGSVATVTPPCADLDKKPCLALLWAVEHGHGSLFRNVLAQNDLSPSQVPEVARALESHKSIRGHWLGGFLACFLLSLHSVDIPSNCDTMNLFLDLGADPVALHSRSQSSPIEILTSRICASAFSAEDEERLIWEIFFHPSVQKALGDEELLVILERLLGSNKRVAINEILTGRPDLKFGFHQSQARKFSEKFSKQSFIGKALNNEIWEEVEILVTQGLDVNTLTLSGTSLLWRAIEMNSDAWIYHLLRLGADPNIGPFEMTHNIDSPSFKSTCYPLEAALWLRRTRVCLELLRYGADIDRIGKTPILIAQETGNWIIAARLYEIPNWTDRQKENNRQPTNEHGRTALAIACNMLSQSILEEPPGFPRPLYNYETTEDWKSELEEIIDTLALDEDAEYVNAQDAEGNTALHHLLETTDAYAKRSKTLVIALLSQGADPNMPNCRGETPLWLAIQNTAPIDSVIQPLLEAGADPRQAHLSQNFPLLKAAMMAYSDISNTAVSKVMKLLLEAGVNLSNFSRKIAMPDPALVSLAKEMGIEYVTRGPMQYADIRHGVVAD